MSFFLQKVNKVPPGGRPPCAVSRLSQTRYAAPRRVSPLGRKRRGDMRRFQPFCDPCAVWILEAAGPIEVKNSVCIRAKHGLCIPAALLRGVGEVGFRGRSMAEPAPQPDADRPDRSAHMAASAELRRRARPRLSTTHCPSACRASHPESMVLSRLLIAMPYNDSITVRRPAPRDHPSHFPDTACPKRPKPAPLAPADV